MKKVIIAILIASSSIALAKDPNVKAYCDNVWKQASPGWVDISSQHGATIINKSPTALVYDIYFDNAIQYPKMREMPLDYSEPPYTPNAHHEYHLKVESGKTLYWGSIPISKVAGFPQKGRYKSSATTTIMYNGTLLDQCVHYTNIDIN